MRCRLGLLSLLSLACKASPEVEWPTPGAEIVLDYARVAGLAWSPLWCRSRSSVRPEVCHRMLQDSSQIGFQWGRIGRPHSFSHDWGLISPIRGFDLRDSIRRDLWRRGARWIEEHPGPVHPELRMHRREAKWCLDSAVVYLGHGWQDGQPLEFVNFLVASVPDRDCSREAFAALPRPNPRMQPTGRTGVEPRSGGTFRWRR
jgi:hypothetical protein